MTRLSLLLVAALAASAIAPADQMTINGETSNLNTGLASHFLFSPTHLQGSSSIRDLASDDLGSLQGRALIVETPEVSFLDLDGATDFLRIEGPFDPNTSTRLPKSAFSASAWVRIDSGTQWGGIIGCLEDTGDYEKGWVLGYDNSAFTFALSTSGSDDGNGLMTYLAASSPYSLQRWHHVAGTFDGATMRLYVNGELKGSSTQQSGHPIYPPLGEFVAGVYKDSNEFFPLQGRLHETKVWHRQLTGAEVASEFTLKSGLTQIPPSGDPDLDFLVKPYLNMPTPTSLVVRWETSKQSTSSVEWGKTLPLINSSAGTASTFNEVLLTGLEPDSHYLYRVRSTTPQGGDLTSDVFQFRTPAIDETAFGFVVICDTQANPEVVRQIATMAYRHRPRFTLLGGDLVTTGQNKSHWLDHFFPNMEPLNTRVPLIPALGNHENNAQLYYDYFTLPEPEYLYKFQYGPLDVFILDSQKSFAPGLEQYTWLEAQLAASTALWKIVMTHKPPYSSDEDDYGNLYQGQSVHGDEKVRLLLPLIDQYHVDIVWSGHIHSYERTFPLRGGVKVPDGEGTVYLITGGGGGGLEKSGPTGAWFTANALNEHHYAYVTINGPEMRISIYRLDGTLYDVIVLSK